MCSVGVPPGTGLGNSDLVTCAHHKQFIILLNKLRLLCYIHATDYVRLSVFSYIISC